MSRIWNITPRPITLTLAALAALALAPIGTARAVPLDQKTLLDSLTADFQYSTSGSISTVGVTGPPVISYNSITDNAFTAPSAFSLGEFLLAKPPEGTTTQYNNTPFAITFLPGGNTPPVVLDGTLNGTVSGAKQTNVVASFTVPHNGNGNGNATPMPISFTTGDLTNSLNIEQLNLSLVPSSTNGGRTTAQARVIVTDGPTPIPVPEPTSIAVFLTAMAGLGLRRRLLVSRDR